MGDFENVKERADLKEYAAQHLEPAPGRARDNYVCPKCGSGTGKNKSAAFYVLPDGRRCYCHVCHWQPDIYELAGTLNKTDEPIEQLRIVAEWAGVPLEAPSGGKPRDFQETWSAMATAEKADAKEGEREKIVEDFTEGREKHRRYVEECARRLAEEPTDEVVSYLSERGITHAEAVRLGLGYDPKPAHGWQDEEGNWHNTARLILPWAGNDYYHIDRAIDARAANIKYDKPPSHPNPDKGITEADCVGAQPIYNPQAFDHDYIIVCEGVMDAIAIYLCGYNAVALGGTATNDFVNEVIARNYQGVIIDMLDADGTSDAEAKNRKGRGAGADLVRALDEAGIATLARAEYGVGETDDYGGHKDAGEWNAENRAALSGKLAEMRDKARKKAKDKKEADYRAAMKSLSVKDPKRVALDILEMRGISKPITTGIDSINDALDGGLNLGELTIFGAISSYGKTTLAVQIADNIAATGHPVLFVTIEQSARELISKSLSHLMYINGTEDPSGHVTTPSEIISLKEREDFGEWKDGELGFAIDYYNKVIAPNLSILEGNDRPTVDNIRAVAEVMKEHSGKPPVIFIDYLQLLAPKSDRDSDKQAADYNVSELRKMARDLNTHIWAISSLNRSSYSGVISIDSFKESGGIEYGADNLMGLQPYNMESDLDDVPESKTRRKADKIVRNSKWKIDRECELVILKRRNGALPHRPLPFTFKTNAAHFIEREIDDEPEKQQEEKL